jgi:hypothetical protein
MDGCTNYKTQWQCPKSDREKTMLIVRRTFSKKLHQLSNTGKKPARRKIVCEQHTDRHTEVGTDSKGERVHTTYMFLGYYYKFSGSE